MALAETPTQTALVSTKWLQQLPVAPVLSSEHLRWQRMSAYRVNYLTPFRIDLPAVGGLYIGLHLRGPCRLVTRWNGRLRLSRSVPGETIIMSPNQENSWDSDSAMDELQIFLDPTLIYEAAAEVTDRHVVLSEGLGIRDGTLSAIADRLIEEMSHPGECSCLVGDSMAHALAAHLLSKHSNLRGTTVIERVDIPPHKLRCAMEYIDTHLGENLSIQAMATALGMSSFRFARGFKKATGRSPHRFLTERRINAAKNLLHSTDQMLGDIARAVGFLSQSHFTVAFRQYCGVTPGGYRELCRDR